MRRQYRKPLLSRSSSPSPSSPTMEPVNAACATTDDEITAAPPQVASLSSMIGTDKCSDQVQRLSSLDVFRGLTIASMILVDDAGGAFPSTNHSPLFGVTLADFVMPFFLFSVGISIGLVFKVDVTERALQYLFRSEKWGTLVFVMVEILFWAVVAVVLHMKGIYIKP